MSCDSIDEDVKTQYTAVSRSGSFKSVHSPDSRSNESPLTPLPAVSPNFPRPYQFVNSQSTFNYPIQQQETYIAPQVIHSTGGSGTNQPTPQSPQLHFRYKEAISNSVQNNSICRICSGSWNNSTIHSGGVRCIADHRVIDNQPFIRFMRNCDADVVYSQTPPPREKPISQPSYIQSVFSDPSLYVYNKLETNQRARDIFRQKFRKIANRYK